MNCKERIAQLEHRFYYNNTNGTDLYLDLVSNQLNLDSVVLDLGCGIGYEKANFRSKAKLVIGCDITTNVTKNYFIHSGVCGDAFCLPFKNNSFHLIFMDYVLEHFEFPEHFAIEVFRVLRPGGVLFFRTPNIYHYVSLIGSLTPFSFHRMLANRVRGYSGNPEENIFPTFYRANSCKKIIRMFTEAGLVIEEILMVENEPSYLRFSTIAFCVGILYERIVNHFEILDVLRANIFGTIRKPN